MDKSIGNEPYPAESGGERGKCQVGVYSNLTPGTGPNHVRIALKKAFTDTWPSGSRVYPDTPPPPDLNGQPVRYTLVGSIRLPAPEKRKIERG